MQEEALSNIDRYYELESNLEKHKEHSENRFYVLNTTATRDNINTQKSEVWNTLIFC